MLKKFLAISLILTLIGTSFWCHQAEASVHNKSGYACKSGNYVYYSFSSSRKSTAIYRINVKTGKKKKVYPKKKSKLKDFNCLNVKGSYLYCSCHKKSNTMNETYIYRINLKTKKAKKLALGANPVLVGKRIIYDGTRTIKINSNYDAAAVPTGIKYSMKTNGKSKKQVTTYSFDNREATYRNRGYQTKIGSGKYFYYITKSGSSLIRERGRSEKIIFATDRIQGFRVLGSYIVVKIQDGYQNTAYLIKNNGKKVYKLISW